MREDKTAWFWPSCLVILWLSIYIPVYAGSYGFWHFLQLCNLGVLISCVGLLRRNHLLISSQAIATLPIAALWLTDSLARIFTGRFIHGGTAYMWDQTIPLITRALSFYHVVLPLILLFWLYRNGYQKHAWKLQGMLAIAVLLAGLFIAPENENLNYVHHWPNGRVLFEQPILHAGISFSVLIFLVYWPTHGLLQLAFKNRT